MYATGVVAAQPEMLGRRRSRAHPTTRSGVPTILAWLPRVIVRSAEQESRARILVVDDDAEIAHALERKLTYVGYVVEVATEPRPVVDRIHSERANWDVVLLDVGLPGI